MRAKLASFAAAAMLLAAMAGCGNTMRNDEARAVATPTAAATGSPRSTANSGVVGGGLVGSAGDAVGDVGNAVGNAVGDVGNAVGNAVGDVGRAAGDLVEGAGNAVGDVANGAGSAVGDVAGGRRGSATATPGR